MRIAYVVGLMANRIHGQFGASSGCSRIFGMHHALAALGDVDTFGAGCLPLSRLAPAKYDACVIAHTPTLDDPKVVAKMKRGSWRLYVQGLGLPVPPAAMKQLDRLVVSHPSPAHATYWSEHGAPLDIRVGEFGQADHGALDSDDPYPTDIGRGRRLIYTGRLNQPVVDSLRAALRASQPWVHLWVTAMDSSTVPHWNCTDERWASWWKGDPRVHPVGDVFRPVYYLECRRWTRFADVALCPPHSAPTQNVCSKLLCAQEAGTPTLADISWVNAERSTWSVDWHDQDALRRAIRDALAAPRDAQAIHDHCVSAYSWRAAAEALVLP